MTRQGGVLTWSQLSAAMGQSAAKRTLRDREWQRITRGVYATDKTITLTHRLWAGHLVAGDGSALGGLATLAASGVVSRVDRIALWVPPGVDRLDRRGFTFHTDGLDPLARTVGTLPSIRIEEALIDLGGELGFEQWVGVLADAVRLGKVSPASVRARLDARPRAPSRDQLAGVLDDFCGIESHLEWLYRRDVEVAHGLPDGRRQHSLVRGTRTDVHYDSHHVIVELDGHWHADTVMRDLDRDNHHATLGHTTLRYGSYDVRRRACEVAAQVATVLRHNGWRGEPRRCQQCARA